MRLGLMIAAMAVMIAPAAHASGSRITVGDAHSFTSRLQNIINSSSLSDTRGQLELVIAENATFTDRVASAGYHAGWAHVGYGYPAYTYYRYPYSPYYYAPVSQRAMSKSQLMGLIWNKKEMIPGYHTNLHVTNVSISPYGNTATVDLEMREYGLAYSPYNPALMQRSIQANSRCRMHLTEMNNNPILTRMDCNTNSNLPL